MKRHCASQRGFSIVEVLVAMAILVFGAFAIYGQFVEISRASHQRLTITQSRLLAHQALQELLACPYGRLAAWTPPAQPSALVSPGQGIQPPVYQDIKIEPTQRGALHVQVTISWASSGQGKLDPVQSVTVEGIKTP